MSKLCTTDSQVKKKALVPKRQLRKLCKDLEAIRAKANPLSRDLCDIATALSLRSVHNGDVNDAHDSLVQSLTSLDEAIQRLTKF
jgi:hypothetical protein